MSSALNKHDPVQALHALFPLLARIVQAQVGQPIAAADFWKNNRQFLAKKFLYHLRTLLRLTEGDTIDLHGIQHRYVDHGSINVLARALLENFIVFEWVFGPSDESLSFFRHLTWVAAGLKDRIDTPTYSEEAKQLQASEGERFSQLCEEIKANRHFKELSNGAQKALLLGKWRMGKSIEEIAVQLGFHSRTFAALYSYLCAYSHSSFISALQTGQADATVEKDLSLMSVGVACNMTARMIRTYTQLFPTAQEVFASASKDEKLVTERWDLRREDFVKTYGPDAAPAEPKWKDKRPTQKGKQ